MSRFAYDTRRLARRMGSAIAACAIVLAPLAFGATPDASELAGPVWKWRSTDGRDGDRLVAADPSHYTLRFDRGGMLRVRADCNGGRGRYDAAADRSLVLSDIATTKKGCGRGSQDRRFLADLREVVGFRVEGNALLLALRSGGTMRFSSTD
jgi:heat shock protein HslJ